MKLEKVQASKDHLIVNVREDGLQAITVYSLPPAGTPVETLSEGQKIKFPEPTYSLEEESSQFDSHIFRYGYSSLRTPQSVYDYDMNTGKTVLKKKKPVCTLNLNPCIDYESINFANCYVTTNFLILALETTWCSESSRRYGFASTHGAIVFASP